MTEKEINKIEKNRKITHCFIRKGGYYYRPNDCGYTEWSTRAGVYTREQAVVRARGCSELDIWPINVFEHNSKLVEEANELLSRYISI